MGFKLLKIGSDGYEARIKTLKELQLKLETDRWRHLTKQDEERGSIFIDRYQQVLDRSIRDENFAASAADLCRGIKTLQPSIVSVQGNLEVARLTSLL